VGSYRGFVFARMSSDGPSLLDWLGDARHGIDEVVDRAPEGEVELTGGVHRYYYRGNWKLQAENLADQYHAPFSHESSVTPDGYQFSRRPGDKGTRIKILGRDGEAGMETKGQWVYPWGHNSGGALTSDGEQDGPVFGAYRAALEAKHGPVRTKEILTHQRHSAYFYPNFDVHVLAQAVRVIRPIRVDLTEILLYPIKLKGAPDEMFHEAVRLLNISHSCSSLGQTDDVEAFERTQLGLLTRGEDWVVFMRGSGRDVPDSEKGGFRGPQYSENGMRTQHESWLRYMVNWQQ
jgi:benzoate/toluate 1,2-dioxygenase alpha subunit